MLLLLVLHSVVVVMVRAVQLLAQLRLVVVERRPFLVLERDHLVATRGRLARWPG